MAIVFRTPGAWGAGQGSNLSPVQVDGNFYDLDQRVEAFETTPPEAISIASIESDGASLFITLTDASVIGPLALPAPIFSPRGAWLPLTLYSYGDTVGANGGVYFVNIPHTSEASFDPGLSETSGAVYSLMFEWPDNVLPTGGSTGMVLAKQTAADYDVEWIFQSLSGLSDVDIATDIAVGDHLVWNGGGWVNQAFALPEPTSGTGATLGGIFAEEGVANNWVYGIDTDGSPLLSQPAFSNISGTVADSQLLQIKRQTVTSSAGVLTINRALGEICKLNLSQNITSIVVNNWPTSGIFGRVVLDITNSSSYTVTGYPGGAEWPDGTQPIITISSSAGSGRDRIILSTDDNGTNVTGDVVGQDYS